MSSTGPTGMFGVPPLRTPIYESEEDMLKGRMTRPWQEWFLLIGGAGRRTDLSLVSKGVCNAPNTAIIATRDPNGMIRLTIGADVPTINGNTAIRTQFQISKNSDCSDPFYDKFGPSPYHDTYLTSDIATFYYRARVENIKGWGDWSAIKSVTTADEILASDSDICSAPQNVTVKAADEYPEISGIELVVEWDPPAVNNATIFGYAVEVYTSADFPERDVILSGNTGSSTLGSKILTDPNKTFTAQLEGKTIWIYSSETGADGYHVRSTGKIVSVDSEHQITLDSQIQLGGDDLAYEIITPTWELVTFASSVPTNLLSSTAPAPQSHFRYVVSNIGIGTWYVRVRAANAFGLGYWSSVVGPVSTSGITEQQIANGAVSITKFASGIRPVEIVDNLPTEGNFEGRIVYYNGKLYRYHNGAWTTYVESSDIIGQIVADQIANAAITTAKFAQGITPVEIVDALPISGNYVGRIVFLTTDNKLYRFDGEEWTTYVESSDIIGQIVSDQIADAAITEIKLATGAVTQDKIGTAAVNEIKLATGAVTESKISDGAVTAGKISSGAVDVTKFASGIRPVEIVSSLPSPGTAGRIVFLTTDNKLYRDTGSAWTAAVPTSDLSGTIDTGLLADDAVTSDKLAEDAVSSSHLIAGKSADLIASQYKTFQETFDCTIDEFNARWHNYAGNGELSIESGGLTGGKVLRVGNNSGDDEAWLVYNKSIPYDESKLYRIRCRIRRLEGSGTCYLGIAGRDATDTHWVNVEGNNIVSSQHYIAATGCSPSSDWTIHTGYFKGRASAGSYDEHPDPNYPAKLHNNVRYFRPLILVNYPHKAGIYEIDEFSIDIIPENLDQIADGDTYGRVLASNISSGLVDLSACTGTITTTQIADDSISTPKLQANSITAAKIAAGQIGTDHLAVNSVTAGKIAAGAVGAEQIAANAITASKLAVVSPSAFPDPYLTQTDLWYLGSPGGTWTFVDWENDPNNAAYKLGVPRCLKGYSSGQPYVEWTQMYGRAVLAIPTKSRYLYLSAVGYNAGSNSSIAVLCWECNHNQQYVTESHLTWAVSEGPSRKSMRVELNSNTAYVYIEVRSYPNHSGEWAISDIQLAFAASAELIVDGAITTDKLAANSVTASKIAAGSITSDHLAANSVTAGKIAAGAIGADQIASGAVTVGKIGANAVETTNIADGAVTTDKIYANAVTASKIAAGSITSDHLAANSVTAGKIAAGAVSSDQIAAGAVTVGKIGTGAVGTTNIADGAITTDKIYVNAVTAAKIAAGAVGTNQLAANAVTAGKISAGAVGADQIAASSITADKLNVSSLSAISANLGAVTSGSLTSVTITSPTIQTAESGSRIVLDTSALVAYDSSGVYTFRVGTDGWVKIRSAATGARMELTTTDGLLGYDSSDNILTQLGLDGRMSLKSDASGARLEIDPSSIGILMFNSYNQMTFRADHNGLMIIGNIYDGTPDGSPNAYFYAYNKSNELYQVLCRKI